MLLSPAVFFLYLLPSPISHLSPLPQEENHSYKGQNIYVQLQKIMTKEQYASYMKKQSEREQQMKDSRRQRQ